MSKSKKRNRTIFPNNKAILSKLDELIRQIKIFNTLYATNVMNYDEQKYVRFDFSRQRTNNKNKELRWRFVLNDVCHIPPEEREER